MFVDELKQLIEKKDTHSLQYYCWPLLKRIKDFTNISKEMDGDPSSFMWKDKLAVAVHDEYHILVKLRQKVEKILDKDIKDVKIDSGPKQSF